MTVSPAAAPPAESALQRLAERYPTLIDPEHAGDLLRVLHLYLDSLQASDSARGAGTDCLLRLARLSGDPGAPAVLLAEYARALDECGVPMAQSRAKQTRVLDDLADTMRREAGAAMASGEAQALGDPISGLPNWAGLHRQVDSLLRESRAAQRSLAVLCIELHHTTALIDQPGHATQEELIRSVGGRLRGALRPGDALARTGMLQFMAALPKLRSSAQALLAAEKVRQILQPGLLLGVDEIHLSIHVGIASYPENAEAPYGLMHFARTAADEARSSSLAAAVYSGSEKAREIDLAELQTDLKHAIEHNDLQLYFQPQLEVASGRVCSVEALLRWERQPGEWISPTDIIQAATGPGDVQTLSSWIIGAALRQVDDWSRQGLTVSVGINLWAKALIHPELPGIIERQLGLWDVPAAQLLIEITEGQVIEEWDRSREMIAHLRRLGVTIAMDDFGTGYSQFSWLRELDIDEIKIDQKFIRDLLRAPKDEPIVRSLISLAHELGLHVVAEGVEDQATQDALARMGCDRIQGYWLSRPLTAGACTEFLRKHGAG